jgi:hypothetical protein
MNDWPALHKKTIAGHLRMTAEIPTLLDCSFLPIGLRSWITFVHRIRGRRLLLAPITRAGKGIYAYTHALASQ